MIHKIFTIYDLKAEAYLPPFNIHQTAMAVRSFAQAINTPDHQFGRNPEDYTLFQIGIFDDETAEITPIDKTVIHTGLELIQGQENDTTLSDGAPILRDTGSRHTA